MTGWVAGLVVGLVSSTAQEWKEHPAEGVQIRTRALSDGTTEVWAEANLDAPVAVLEEVLTTPELFPRFMPFVKEARTLPNRAPGGEQLVYTKLDFPMFVSSRDYVLKLTLDETTRRGGLSFRNHWVAVADAVPSRDGVVRMTHNSGSWHIQATSETTSRVSYVFSVDPGGTLPSFAQNFGRTEGVVKLLNAVETEAQERVQKQGAKAGR